MLHSHIDVPWPPDTRTTECEASQGEKGPLYENTGHGKPWDNVSLGVLHVLYYSDIFPLINTVFHLTMCH